MGKTLDITERRMIGCFLGIMCKNGFDSDANLLQVLQKSIFSSCEGKEILKLTLKESVRQAKKYIIKEDA